MENKGQTLHSRIPPEIPSVRADYTRLRQVLINLIGNAIKFAPQGGQIEVSAAALAEFVQVTVSDNGVGVPPEHQQRIFRAFEQVDSSLSRQQQGTGLGLPLVSRLIALHGGEVRLESEGIAGRGTRIHFTLPYAPPRWSGPETGPPILLIEDHALSAELLENHLHLMGYRTCLAPTGNQGIRLAAEICPLAITLDIALPDIDGWEVLSRLKSDPKTSKFPVIVISTTDDAGRSLNLGAAFYLAKPVSSEHFVQVMEQVVKRP